MKRLRVSRHWIVPGILFFVVLLGVSVSQVLAGSSRPAAPGSADPVAGIDSYSGKSTISAQGVMTTVAYLPVFTKGHWTEKWEEEHFQDYSGGWPYNNSSEPFSYGYLDDGTAKVYHIGMDDEGDLAFVTGPMTVAGDFEYDALFRRALNKQPLFYYDECGILVSPAPITPTSPSGADVYSFGIQYKIGGGVKSSYIIAKWNALNMNNRTVLWVEQEDYNLTDEPKFWNWFTISRVGDTLSFSLKRWLGQAPPNEWTTGETSPLSHTDATLPDELYVGFYAYHSKDDNGNYRLEFQFDDVRTHSVRP